MRTLNFGLFVGGLFGFLAIALGAYTEHVLTPLLTAHDADILAAALRYQLVHAAVLAGLGVTTSAQQPQPMRIVGRLASVSFAGGLILFCGGLEAGTILRIPALFALAPLGGICLMLGWLLILGMGFIKARKI